MRDRLALINQISDELNKDLDLDNMLQRVIDLTVDHFNATTGSIMLLDEDRRVSKYILQQKNISNARANDILGQVLSEGFAGWVLDHGVGDVINETQEDSRWYVYPDQPYTTRSVIATPLTRRNRIVGVLTITHKVPHHFKKDDLPLLTAIAGQAAIALENAQLFHATELERAKLSAIIDSSEDAILVIDPATQAVLLLNPAAAKILGLAENGWLNRPLTDISSFDSLVTVVTGNPENVSDLTLPDGRTMSPSIIDIPNLGRLTRLHDISALKALDKMKSEFVITFTHDLAAPLAAIKGYIELIHIDGALTDQQEEDLTAIRMSVDQMRTLLQDLQELTRLETLKKLVKRDITLNQTLLKSHRTFQPIAEAKNITLILNGCAKPLVTYGNPALISRAVENLVENAIKYTKVNGQVTISLSENHNEAHIAVADTGIGIPPQKLSQIFEKFFRAHPPNDNETPGSGLGLSIVKAIVERHGGRIWVESRIEEGSTFIIALPLNDNGNAA